jgi:hypothetical protein
MKKRSSYEVMKSAVDKKFTPTAEEIKSMNSFFLIRYVSNDPNSIYIANILNCNPNIPIEAQYNFIRNSTLDKVAFINYPKKEKTLPQKDLKVIMKHYNINEKLAKEYISIMGEEKTNEILEKYKNIKIK